MGFRSWVGASGRRWNPQFVRMHARIVLIERARISSSVPGRPWSVNQPAARPRPSACGGVRTDVEHWRGGLPPPRLPHRRRWPSHRAAASLRGRRHRPRTPTPSSRVGLSVPTLSSAEPARAAGNLRNQAESGGIPATNLPAAPERSAPRSSAVLVEPRWRTPPSRHPSTRRAPTTIPAMLTRAPTMAPA